MTEVLCSSEHPDLALLAWRHKRAICCLAMEDAQDAQLSALLALNPFHIYRHGRETALLFTPGEDETLDGMWARELERRLTVLGLHAGLSGPFALAASAHGCMHKARLALETGRRLASQRMLYPMDEFGEAALLDAAAKALAAQDLEREDFCDAAIVRMQELDLRSGTRYAESLHAYLRYGLDLRRAAQALGVHRNTLSYRMKRAQELFAIDLSDMNTCFELLFSFWLMEHLPAGERRARPGASFDADEAQEALWEAVERRAQTVCADAAAFECVLLCVGVRGLADDERIQLLNALRAAGDAKGMACAYDEDVLLFALAPGLAAAFEAESLRLCGERSCPVVVTQAFSSARIAKRARLCRMALCAAVGACARTQDMNSTLFFMTLERTFSLSPYLCEDVIRVMDDDATKGASLSRSLYAYLLHFRDMRRAAQQLGMHRNTMEYQMRKIDALIGKPSDERRRFLMMCTYKMLALPEVSRYGL